MDYLCGKFGDCSFSRFGSIARTNRQTHRQTRMNALLPRLSSWMNTSCSCVWYGHPTPHMWHAHVCLPVWLGWETGR